MDEGGKTEINSRTQSLRYAKYFEISTLIRKSNPVDFSMYCFVNAGPACIFDPQHG